MKIAIKFNCFPWRVLICYALVFYTLLLLILPCTITKLLLIHFVHFFNSIFSPLIYFHFVELLLTWFFRSLWAFNLIYEALKFIWLFINSISISISFFIGLIVHLSHQSWVCAKAFFIECITVEMASNIRRGFSKRKYILCFHVRSALELTPRIWKLLRRILKQIGWYTLYFHNDYSGRTKYYNVSAFLWNLWYFWQTSPELEKNKSTKDLFYERLSEFVKTAAKRRENSSSYIIASGSWTLDKSITLWYMTFMFQLNISSSHSLATG